MITIEQMVSRNVHYCVSSLVISLAGAAGKHDSSAEGTDLSALACQAFNLAAPALDYEEAAREAGWSVVLHHGAGWRAIRNGAASDDDVTDYNSSESEAWRDACDSDNLDPYEWEVYEHWIVSDWLANKLEAHGEKVDKDFAGMTVWARTTTGQAIAMDSVIENIYADLTAAK